MASQPEQAKELYAVQWPTAASIFAGRTTEAAWHSKPSWYAVSKNDGTINPDFERFLAKRMNATTIELDAGHLSLVSHPKDVANLILEAAGYPRQLSARLPNARAPAISGAFFCSGLRPERGAQSRQAARANPAPAPPASPASAVIVGAGLA